MTPLQEAIAKAFKAKETVKKPYSEEEYPTMTTKSSRGQDPKIVARDGKIVNLGGRKKFVAVDPKPYAPLRKDTESGYGEKRRRYIR